MIAPREDLAKRHPMLKQMKKFLKDESGAAAIEYGLITSGISVVIIPGVKDVGTKLVAIFTLLQNAI
jgi:Flp pilus assembly pilin Flp